MQRCKITPTPYPQRTLLRRVNTSTTSQIAPNHSENFISKPHPCLPFFVCPSSSHPLGPLNINLIIDVVSVLSHGHEPVKSNQSWCCLVSLSMWFIPICCDPITSKIIKDYVMNKCSDRRVTSQCLNRWVWLVRYWRWDWLDPRERCQGRNFGSCRIFRFSKIPPRLALS